MLSQEVWSELYRNRARILELEKEKEQMLAQIIAFHTTPDIPYNNPNLLEDLILKKKYHEEKERHSLKAILNWILVTLKLKEKNNE